ncbi:plancitoxin-1-like [Aulostomus maculatus]
MWRLVLVAALISCSSEGQVTCRDENNGEQDWFILYKEPKTSTSTGLEYLYIDSQGVRERTARGGAVAPNVPYKPIDHRSGVLANTLTPLFTPTRVMLMSLLWSSGVVMVEKDASGVWLLHSTPQFPFARDPDHFWPQTGTKEAQIFICVTFSYDKFRQIGAHLQYIGAGPFQYDIPADFHEELRNAVNLVQAEPLDEFVELNSKGGVTFRSIAKPLGYVAEDGDLYVTLSERIAGDVWAQTWGCQALPSKSFCEINRHKVENVQSVRAARGGWKSTIDHSKWCVTADANKHWTCIADVNRANTQFGRRGGALCIEDAKTHEIFHGFVGNIEKCDRGDVNEAPDTSECAPDSDWEDGQ